MKAYQAYQAYIEKFSEDDHASWTKYSEDIFPFLKVLKYSEYLIRIQKETAKKDVVIKSA
ncbi:MAG: hypothetical protein ABIJ31_07635 [Pseudomonadota bacterium]